MPSCVLGGGLQESAAGGGCVWMVVLAGLLAGAADALQREGMPLGMIMRLLGEAMGVAKQVGSRDGVWLHLGHQHAESAAGLRQPRPLSLPLCPCLTGVAGLR